MKKILKFSVLLGLVVILALGGYLFFHLRDLKTQAENSLNYALENKKNIAQEFGVQIKYVPFECSGLFYIECKSPKIEAVDSRYEDGQPIMVLNNVNLTLSDVDSKSLTIKYLADIDYIQKEGLDDCFDVLIPQKIQSTFKLSLETQDSFILESHWNFSAKNADYDLTSEQKIISQELKEKGLLNYIKEVNFDYQDIYLKSAKLELNSKDLSRAFFEAVKKQYKTIDFEEYSQSIQIISIIGAYQFSDIKAVQQAIFAIQALLLGEKTKLILEVNLEEGIQSNELYKALEQMSVQTFD